MDLVASMANAAISVMPRHSSDEGRPSNLAVGFALRFRAIVEHNLVHVTGPQTLLLLAGLIHLYCSVREYYELLVFVIAVFFSPGPRPAAVLMPIILPLHYQTYNHYHHYHYYHYYHCYHCCHCCHFYHYHHYRHY